MKHNITIAISVLLLLTVSSCDFLEKEPHELTPETYYNNEDELQTALLGVYSPLMQEPFYGENYITLHVQGDDLSFYQRSTPRIAMMCAAATSTAPEIMTLWRILYEGINRANVVLENADNVPASEISEESRSRIKAEAYFLRSFYYFHLVQLWGDVPLKLSSTQSVNGLAIARTDKEQVYDQLIKDIEDNISYLPTAAEVTTPETVSQTAAMGILARIYLFRAGEHYRDGEAAGSEVDEYFEKARDWAKKVYESGLHDLVEDYSQVFKDLAADKYNSTGIRESIFEVAEAGNRINDVEFSAGKLGSTIGFGHGADFSGNSAYNTLTGMANPGYCNRSFFCSLKLYRMFYEPEDGDEVDRERGDWNIAPYSYVTDEETGAITGRDYYYGLRPEGMDYYVEEDGTAWPCDERTESESASEKVRCVGKFYREYEEVTPKSRYYTPTNFPVLRYSDVLLMLAEAENEVNDGPTELAYTCLNKVRARAGLGAVSGLDQTTFREKIKTERAKELCFEGLRRWDLIRWGDFYSAMRGMTDYVNDDDWKSVYKYAADYYLVNQKDQYFPIPDWEMSNSPLMKQNPGW